MTFVDSILQGNDENIDDWVDRWHNDPDPKMNIPLHEFLGFTWEEYARWVEKPSSLVFILEGIKLRQCGARKNARN